MRKLVALFFVVAISTASIILSGCTPIFYQLTTSVIPAGSGTVSPATGTFKGGNNATLVASPAKYFKFIGWAGDVSGNTNPLPVKMDSNKNIVASFAKIQYDLSEQIIPSNSGVIDPKSGTYDAGINIKVTATPSSGYRFGNWGGSATGSSNQIDLLMDNNKTITANFIRQYTLKVAGEPLNAGNVLSAAGLYDEGKIIKLSATPTFPYYPKTWVGTDTSTNPTTVTMSSDKSVKIIFEPTIKGPLNSGTGECNNIYSPNPTESTKIELKQYEWVQGKVGTGPQISAKLQDPNGNVINNFGSGAQANFSFMAQTPGIYTISFTNTGIFNGVYNFEYTIYHLP